MLQQLGAMEKEAKQLGQVMDPRRFLRAESGEGVGGLRGVVSVAGCCCGGVQRAWGVAAWAWRVLLCGVVVSAEGASMGRCSLAWC